MMAPIRVLDGHMHLLTAETHQEEAAWLPAMSARWLGTFDRYGITAAVFLALAPRPEALRRFVALTAAHPGGGGAFTRREDVEAFIRSRRVSRPDRRRSLAEFPLLRKDQPNAGSENVARDRGAAGGVGCGHSEL